MGLIVFKAGLPVTVEMYVPLVEAIVFDFETNEVEVCVTVGVGLITVVDGVVVIFSVTVTNEVEETVVLGTGETELVPYFVVQISDDVVLCP